MAPRGLTSRRRIGRVRHVGPPEPFSPTSPSGIAWTSQPAASRPRRVTGLPSATITTPGRTASTLQPSVGYSSSGTSTNRMPRSRISCPQPDRQQRQVDDRDVVGDRRHDRQQVDELGRAPPVRDVEDPDVAADDLGELPRPRVVRPERPPDAQQVRPQPERVAALDRPRRLDPAGRRDPGGERPRLDDAGLAGPVRLARPERDRAAVGDQQRVEDVGEIRVVVAGRLVEDVDGGAQSRQRIDETRRARAAPGRGRPAGGSRSPASSNARPNAVAGPAHEHLARAPPSCSARRKPGPSASSPQDSPGVRVSIGGPAS